MWRVRGARVILVAVPKCGTHLVRRLLNVSGMRAAREIFYNTEETVRILDDMLAACRGDALVTHLQARREYLEVARAHGARVVFITRDPRDQVVSHAFHYRLHEEHPLHPYFRDEVPELDDAILAVIRGIGPGPWGHLADVDTFFRMFLPWRERDGVYHTTFERLVGPAGHGAADAQRSEVEAILAHIGFPVATRAAARAVATRVFSKVSPTFRRGQIGSWREHFTARHRAAFKEVAGPLLIDLGYERDLDW